MKRKLLLVALIPVMVLSANGITKTVSSHNSNKIKMTTATEVKTIGTETATSHTILVYYNQPNLGLAYKVFVEDGANLKETNGSEELFVSIDGYTSKGLFTDKFGINEYDQESAVTGDLSLYAYCVPNASKGDVYNYVEEGTYTITWQTATGTSYIMEDGSILPKKANEGQSVSFKLALNVTVKEIPNVYVNDEKVTPVDGIYSFTVNSNITVSADDSKVTYEDEETLSDYYLYGNFTTTNKDETYRLSVDNYPVYSDEQYHINNVTLSKGDYFKIYDSVNDSSISVFENEDAVINEDGYYVATERGNYNVYLKVTGSEKTIYVQSTPLPNEEAIDVTIKNCELGYTYYAWTWGGDIGDKWLEGKLTADGFTFNLPANTTGFLIGKFVEGTKASECVWTGSPFIAQTNDIIVSGSKTTYTCSWK